MNHLDFQVAGLPLGLAVCRVTVGDYTLFGPAVQIYTATHPMNPELRRKQECAKPIEVGSDVWVGGGVIQARRYPTQCRELMLFVLTYNLMLD